MESTGKRSLRAARRRALFVGILIILVPAVGSAATVVVPNAQAAAEGNTASAFPFNCASFEPSMRYQQVYLASEVGTGTITEIRFRQDGGGAGAAFILNIFAVTITLSSTSNGPGTLSTTFADNVGADVRVVYSGILGMDSAASAAVPRPFDIVISLQTSFFFDAAAGKNLLLDVTLPICPVTTFFDAHFATFNSVSRVVSTTSSADATGDAATSGLVTQFTITPTSVSPGQAGDALIFPLWDVNNLNTLIAIESVANTTALYLVRFRDDMGSEALEFTLCLSRFSTWTAAIFREGPLTRVQSTNSTLLVNGVAQMLNATLAGNPTRGYIEVIGLRGTSSPSLAICTDPAIGGDVQSNSVGGKAYYVNPLQSPLLAYGANALALRDFDTVKITDGTVLGNNRVAKALIAQGGVVPGPFQSTAFDIRYFVAPGFGAITQVVTTFAAGPSTGVCPSCRIPTSLTFIPFTESGTILPGFSRTTAGKLVNVNTVTSADIPGSDGGILNFFESPAPVASIPIIGFGVQTTTNTMDTIFNVLFPLTIQ